MFRQLDTGDISYSFKNTTTYQLGSRRFQICNKGYGVWLRQTPSKWIDAALKNVTIELVKHMLCAKGRTCRPLATTPNIVGCYMSRLFGHPVASCCVLLGVAAQGLKPVKL